MFELMPFGRNDLYRPFRDLENLERSFFSGKELGGFKTDIKDTGDAYVLEADLPGFRKEDIDLDVKDGVLTISAKHQADDRTAADNYICRERRTGSFSRSSHRAATLAHGTPHRCAASTVASSQLGAITGTS